MTLRHARGRWRSTLFALSTLSSMVALSGTGNACRVVQSPDQRIQEVRRTSANLKVALVTIDNARHLSSDIIVKLQRLNPKLEAPWRATATVTRIITDHASPELIVFDRNWGSASCDDGTSIPRRGDKWIVYYTSDFDIGAPEIIESYPLATALKADALLGNMAGR